LHHRAKIPATPGNNLVFLPIKILLMAFYFRKPTLDTLKMEKRLYQTMYADSYIEYLFLKRVLGPATLPEIANFIVPQFPVKTEDKTYKIDFGLIGKDDKKYAIELDGFAFHKDRDTFNNDRDRSNNLVADGWQVIHFTYKDVTQQAEKCIRQLRQILMRDGLLKYFLLEEYEIPESEEPKYDAWSEMAPEYLARSRPSTAQARTNRDQALSQIQKIGHKAAEKRRLDYPSLLKEEIDRTTREQAERERLEREELEAKERAERERLEREANELHERELAAFQAYMARVELERLGREAREANDRADRERQAREAQEAWDRAAPERQAQETRMKAARQAREQQERDSAEFEELKRQAERESYEREAQAEREHVARERAAHEYAARERAAREEQARNEELARRDKELQAQLIAKREANERQHQEFLRRSEAQAARARVEAEIKVQFVRDLNHAVTLFQAGKKPEAYSELTLLQLINPQDPTLLMWLAYASPHKTEALIALENLQRIDPNNPNLPAAFKWLKVETQLAPAPRHTPINQPEPVETTIPPLENNAPCHRLRRNLLQTISPLPGMKI
jgi:hypothetical protein